MAKQLNVNLAFNADTGKAKAQVQELQTLLSKIAYTGSTSIGSGIEGDLQRASAAAKELQIHLNNAFNATTGKFDLSMLDKSLKTSNANISELANNLLGMGASGQQAFVQLAQAIAMADQPMLRINSKLREFATTMRNTVRWQLSSSMLHGFMGALQSAYGYAQDLNKSLTDIRIVTGASSDEMAKFAEQANKAAKTLSTTTTDYTKASLIYFQQGLSDAEVAERTQVTIKMANAAGTSAQVVSDQMTAVWNNFDDGSKSLEYYADVMTALGAATASSTDEIAQGLQKFAAVAETVGLSYEYATAALATVTAETRESADTVGTAFKTLFARIQGLSLGETLEDGVNLNKYSEALGKIGVSVLDANGNIREMNDILDDLGAKWQNLTDAEKQATAQTVAGVRQYTHLMALMENWDVFQSNLGVVENAEGTLTKQAEIYAESWEAASKRVKASAEGIYQSLLDDKFFIGLNNGLATAISGIDTFIDNAGGLKSVLTGIGSILLATYAQKIPEMMKTFTYNLSILTKKSTDSYKEIQQSMADTTQKIFAQNKIDPNSADGLRVKFANELAAARTRLTQVSDRLTDSERQLAEQSLSFIERQQAEVVALKEKNVELEQSISLQAQRMMGPDSFNRVDMYSAAGDRVNNAQDNSVWGLLDSTQLASLETTAGGIATTINDKLVSGLQAAYGAMSELDGEAIELSIHLNEVEDFQNFVNLVSGINLDFLQDGDITELQSVKWELESILNILPDGIQEATGLGDAMRKMMAAPDVASFKSEFENVKKILQECKIDTKDFEKALNGLQSPADIKKFVADLRAYAQNAENAKQKTQALQNSIASFNPTHAVRTSEALGRMAGMAGNAVTIMNSLKSAVRTLSSPDASGWEKFSAVLSGIAFTTPAVISLFSSSARIVDDLRNSFATAGLAVTGMTEAQLLNAQAARGAALASELQAGSVQLLGGAVSKEVATEIAALTVQGKSTQEDLKATLIKYKLADATNAGTIASMLYSAAQVGETYTTREAIITKLFKMSIQAEENKQLVRYNILVTIAKALTGDWMSILKVAGVILGAVAAVGFAKWLEEIIVTQEEANEAMAEANQAYKDQQSTVSSLESELSSLQDRIKELQSMDSLSLVEQQELDLLLSQEASLSRQLSIEQQILETKRQQAALEFENNYKTGSGWLNGIPKDKTYVDTVAIQSSATYEPGQNGYTSGTSSVTTGMAYGAALQGQQTKEQYDEITMTSDEYYKNVIKPLEDAAARGEKLDDEQLAKVNGYYDDLAATEEARRQWYLDNADQIKTYREGLANWLEVNQDATPEEIEEKIRPIVEADKVLYGDDYEKEVYGSKNVERQLGLENLNIDKQLLNDFTADGKMDMTGEQLAGQFSEGFKRYLYQNGIIPEDYAQWLIDEGNTLISGVTEKLKVTEEGGGEVKLEDLQKDPRWQEGDLELLAQIKIEGEDDLDSIFNKIRNIQTAQFDLAAWTKQYNEVMEIIGDLKTGDTIEAEEYAKLTPEAQEYFAVQNDGTAILVGRAEDLMKTVRSTSIGELTNNIRDRQKNAYGTTIVASGTSGAQTSLEGAHTQAMNGSLSSIFHEGYIDAVNEKLGTQYTTLAEASAAWEAYLNELGESQTTLAKTADSIETLDSYMEQGLITREQYDESFSGVLMNEALSEGIDPDELMSYAKYLQDVNEELKKNPQLAQRMAMQMMKTRKGVTTMSKSIQDWSKAISNSDKDIVGYTKAMDDMKDAYKDVFNTIDPEAIDNLSNEFLSSAKMMGLMEKALAGDEQAWNDWEAAVLTEINNTHSAFAGLSEDMKSQMNDLVVSAANLDFSGLTPGADIQDEAFLAKLANMEFASADAAAAMSESLSSVGVDAEIVEHTREVPGHSTTVRQTGGFWVTPPGGEPFMVDIQSEIQQTEDPYTQTYYTLEGAKYNGGGVRPSVDTGGGGGGGGGSKKHAEKKGSSDRTRYHTIQNQLEDLSSAYDDVSEAADRAFGANRLKLIDEQIDATDDLIAKQEEYVDALKADLPKDKAIMEAYYNKNIGGPAMEFDESGNISNYDAIEEAMHQKWNEMAAKYTDDSEEWQVFEKQYEQMEKYIEQYEETYDMLRDEEQAYQDLLNQRADLELTKIQYKAELSLNIEDDEIAVIEHQLDMLGDNAFKAAEAIELQIEKAEAVYDKIQVNQAALNDILGQQLSQKEIELFYSGDMSVLEGKNFTDNQIQAIKEYRDNLLDLNSDMMEVRENIQEQVMATFDAWNEKLESGMATLDHYGSVLDSYRNIIDTVGKDVLGLSDAFMSDLGEAQVSNAIDQVNAARDAYESMMHAQSEAEAALAQARANGDEESIKYWEDTLQSITENAQSAQENLLGTWEEALSAIATQFENAVQMVVDTFNDSVYALGGLEGLSEDFSRQLENSDVMLDDYHKIYELSKLTRDINGKLDDTKIIAGKQKLKDLLEEINEYQQDGVEMSQYDLEYLQKEYDLRLAEIELEEAQRAKSTVRMSRDNEGNWSYVYTQNTDAVDSAQQKYEDALYAMQDLSSNYIDEMSEQLIATSQEMQEALAAIRIEDYASIDEYYAEVARVQAQYQQELAMQEGELNKAIANNKELYDTDWTNYHNATGYKISDTKDFATTFKDTLLGTLMNSEEDTSNFTSIIGSAVATMADGLMQAAQTYYTNLEAAMNAAGTSTGDFAEDTAANIDAVVEKSKEGAAAVDQMAKEMDEAFTQITAKVSTWQETYGLAMQSIIDSNIAVVNSFNDMLTALSIDADKITVQYDINTSPTGDPAGFDTGGYTGEWGDVGKLAVLHEKELVLNQGDTEQFFKAMAYSKMILDTIDLNAKQASLGMGQITPAVIKEEAPQALEQQVHITAEFPGVNDHYEIEEAFNTLINRAAQYANRKF